jgi:hypothetical protein
MKSGISRHVAIVLLLCFAFGSASRRRDGDFNPFVPAAGDGRKSAPSLVV